MHVIVVLGLYCVQNALLHTDVHVHCTCRSFNQLSLGMHVSCLFVWAMVWWVTLPSFSFCFLKARHACISPYFLYNIVHTCIYMYIYYTTCTYLYILYGPCTCTCIYMYMYMNVAIITISCYHSLLIIYMYMYVPGDGA